jgi:hypothetical protein
MVKNLLVLTVAALCAAICTFSASADISDFLGRWENPTREGGLYHVVVTPAGNSRVNVRLYGDCHPGECDWGVEPADGYEYAPHSKAVIAISALVHYGFAHRRIRLSLGDKGGLNFSLAVNYAAGTGKRDFSVGGGLKPTGWIGVGKSTWEQPVGRDAGWGGGARGMHLTRPAELCVAFDPNRLRLRRLGKEWVVASGNTEVIRTAWDEKIARRAVAVIKRYGFDRKCHTGTMEFWKRGDGFPADDKPGVGCLKFTSTTAHAAQIGRSWKVIDGDAPIADMNVSRDNAYAVLALVRAYRLERKCAIGWPNPAMTYWLKAEE